jgi:hypothetical protein
VVVTASPLREIGCYSCAVLLWLLSIQPLQAKAVGEGEVANLAYGEVLYQFYQERYFDAIVHLTAALQKAPMAEQGSDAELLLGGLYLSYGMHDEAERILNQLLLEEGNEALHDRIHFYLAKSRYRRGLLPAAERSLTQIKDQLPIAQQQEQQLIYGQLLLDQSRDKEAVVLLSNLQGDSTLARYGQYNLAIAQLRLGDVGSGQTLLQHLGRMEVSSDELAMLRDQANLTIGSWLLQQGDLDQAKGYLNLIRINNMLSNDAILAAGWGYAEQEDYPEALAHWIALSQRSTAEPVVQDALLAIPYAFLQLNAKPQAIEHYNSAIAIYQHEMVEVAAAQTDVQSDAFTNRYLLNSDAESKEIINAYLQPLVISHPFQTALQSLRDLQAIEQNLTHWSSELGTFDTMLAAREQNYEEKLPLLERSTAIEQFQKLRQQQQQQRQYLTQIRANSDALALATSKERRALTRLETVESRLPQLAGSVDQEEVAQRTQLFRGILLWQTSSDFQGRLWNVEKGLRESEELLEQIQVQQNSLIAIKGQQKATFAHFAKQISTTAGQTKYLKPIVSELIDRQRTEIREASLAYLKQQQLRLESYLTQAQFAIAQIHDEALKKSERQSQ